MNRHGRRHVVATHAKTISMTIRMVFSHAEIYCTKMIVCERHKAGRMTCNK